MNIPIVRPCNRLLHRSPQGRFQVRGYVRMLKQSHQHERIPALLDFEESIVDRWGGIPRVLTAFSIW